MSIERVDSAEPTELYDYVICGYDGASLAVNGFSQRLCIMLHTSKMILQGTF